MAAGMDTAPPAAIQEGGGVLKWPPPAITARAGCITATGEREHQRLYLPSLMGRTENEVSRSMEKYAVWDRSGEGAAAEGNLFCFFQLCVDSEQCVGLHFIICVVVSFSPPSTAATPVRVDHTSLGCL